MPAASLLRLLAYVLLAAGAAAGAQEMRPPAYYLPSAPAASTGKGAARSRAAAGSAKLDLNTATVDELKVLPGMGVVYARRVIAGRPYHAKNQLIRRGILPPAVYAGIQDRVVAHSAR